MKQSHRILSILLSMLLGFIVFIFFYHHYKSDIHQQAMLSHERVINMDLWSLDPHGTIEYLSLAAEFNHYEKITIFSLNNEEFVSIQGPDLGPVDAFFTALGLISKVDITVDIKHENKKIGQLVALYHNKNIYIYFSVFMFLLISYIAISLFLRTTYIKYQLQKNEFNRVLFDYTPLKTMVVDNDGRIISFNKAVENSASHTLPEIGQIMYKDYAANNNADMYSQMMDCIDTEKSNKFNSIQFDQLFLNINISHFPNGAIIVYQDVTEQKQAEEKLRLSSRVFSDSHEGISITDKYRKIIDVNPAFSSITGYSQQDVIGKSPMIRSSNKHDPDFYAAMWQAINQYGQWQGEVWNQKKDGEHYAELLTVSSLKDQDNHITNYIEVFTDITQNKRQTEKLQMMANYDELTRLPNRSLFSDRFNQAIAHSKRTKTKLAICFVDLDNFKPINDNHGHEVGDQILIEVAKRISASIREEDTVSRQGGDEFTILLGHIQTYSQCEQTMQRLHKSLAQPYLIEDYMLSITASSGITLYPKDKGDIDTLLRHADQAMYQAKLSGKNRYHLYDPEHDKHAIKIRHQLDEIKKALDNNEFTLYYQPKVNMVSGEVFGVEALIRWLHPVKGLIPPLDFLPLIDGTRLEIQIGDWVINEALKQLSEWNKQEINLEVSVNIASHYLQSNAFFSQLQSALANYPNVDPHCLQLEILESSALGDIATITNVIKSCQDILGVNIALDDFGTGYSSLTHLRNLPVNIIKIDQTFIRDMLDDPSDFAIIDGVIGLADSFNRDVIAEGVETTEHGLMLLSMGCNNAQGYGIAKPMPAEDIANWLNNYSVNQQWCQCGSEYHSLLEKKVTLFQIISNQWNNKFSNNIQSDETEEQNWPIMDSLCCPCGIWIKRAIQEQLLSSNSLDQLQQSHDSLHKIATVIKKHFDVGEFSLAQEGLADMQQAFKAMNSHLNS